MKIGRSEIQPDLFPFVLVMEGEQSHAPKPPTVRS
jgi:hypothetical protein